MEHAHLHLVPAVPDLWPLAEDSLPWMAVDGLIELQEAAGDHEYLALHGRTGGWQVAIAPPEGYPSQLLRRLTAQAIGRAEGWNWRHEPRLDTTETSWRMAKELASS